MACPWPELLPSYFLATVNQRLVWLFQMYFQTICDRIWSCFRAPTCQLIIDIQLDARIDTYPYTLTPISYKTLSCWGFKAALPSCPAVSGLVWRRAQVQNYNKETLMQLHWNRLLGGLSEFTNASWYYRTWISDDPMLSPWKERKYMISGPGLPWWKQNVNISQSSQKIEDFCHFRNFFLSSFN